MSVELYFVFVTLAVLAIVGWFQYDMDREHKKFLKK